MTPRSKFSLGVVADSLSNMIRRISNYLTGSKPKGVIIARPSPIVPNKRIKPLKSGAASAEAVQQFAKRRRTELKELGLVAGPEGLSCRESLAYSHRDITLTLVAEGAWVYNDEWLTQRELKNRAAARIMLSQIHKNLSGEAKALLSDACGAIKALIDLALKPSELRWLGGEAAVRTSYLSFPPELTAREAMDLARDRRREMLARSAKARSDFLSARVEKVPAARLNGKDLARTYIVNIPLYTSQLELELTIEKTLDYREMDRLSDAPEATFEASIDASLAGPKRSLVQRVEEQLDELTERIRTLPHIELISDAEIAQTVAPYYGGLNRALKKRRAKSALVAVEECAREAKYQDDVVKLNEQRSAYADVAAYYPLARSIKRQLILYVGPTNSGKTWRSLNELAASESGAYLAPLRLLALEGQEELEKRGKPTSFLTGEERDLKPDALFVSSTIEMLNLESQVGAVVIDEVQLLADERRGWAWLAAVLGAPAQKVIMTGSPDCVDIVKGLAAYLNEELIIHECTRYNELRVAPAPIRLKDIRPGTAVVCFSRRDVLRIKSKIQEGSDHKVAVVYGNLSPQVRREEARRFRSGEADILVATDAIAMGLNLPIAEVLFYATEKFNGEEVSPLTQSEIRQIGGRAGRHGFADFGMVNALTNKSLEMIRQAINGTSEALKPPYFVSPGRNHINIISQVLGTDSLERILTFFERAIEFSDERFARSNIDDLSYLSTFVDERLPFLPLTDRLTIASAPIGIRNETVVRWFLDRLLPAFEHVQNPHEELDELEDLFSASERFNHDTARHQLELRDAEDYLKTLTVYAWLSYRYPATFPRIVDCEEQREKVNAFVERSLRGGAMSKRCSSCDVVLPADFTFSICEECHGKKREGRRPGQRGGSRRRGGQRRRSGGGNNKGQTQQAQ